jgi:hypothetical protein
MSTQQDYWLRKIEGDLAAICDGDEDEVAERMAKIEGVPFQKTSRENVPRRNVFSSREISKATAPPEQQAFALWDCYTSLLAKVGGLSKGQAITAGLRSDLGREMFAMAKAARGDSGDSGNQEAGRIQFPGAPNSDSSGRGQRSLTDVVPSQKDAHAALREHAADVQKLVAGGMSYAKADAQVRSANPDRWAKAMKARGRSPLGLPHDSAA